MAMTQQHLPFWQEIEEADDLERLKMVLASLEDEDLMRKLEKERKGRRDENPLRPTWNSLVAGIVFRHATIASLRAELKRNSSLRELCGFDPGKGKKAVPSRYAYSRLILKLTANFSMIMSIYHRLVDRLSGLLGDLGVFLAADGKAIPACGPHDVEAAVGSKTQEEDVEGTGIQKVVKSWYGYKLHMLCDAKYEMPLSFCVTKANEHESQHLLPLVEDLEEHHPSLLERSEELSADRGYDDGADKKSIYDTYGIFPLIPPRDLTDGRMAPLDPHHHDTVYVSPTGEVCCKVDPFATRPEAVYCAMQFQGFEANRETLKFRCPAAAFGVECKNQAACRSASKDQEFGRVLRVPLSADPRLHLPVYRHSVKFQTSYKRRTSVERLFSRLDNLYGFERHYLVGKDRVELRLAMTLTVMLATAVTWIELGETQNLRKTLQAA